MKTQRVPTPDLNLSYDIFVGATPIPIPPALAQQYKLSLFRISRDEHIDISNIQYKVIGKESTLLSVRVNAVVFADPAEPSSTPGSEPSTSESDPTEKHHHNDPTIIESTEDFVLRWSSETEGSYLRIGDMYKDMFGRTRYIQRVRHTLFTATHFNVNMVLGNPI
ncbi:hypothetical protein [Pseudomonas gingeri]|uniref:Uncharacterized protein n=1 Tax=Pseudomonas gingeri TaxID=117681 RepID=A0A7Y7YFP9_9PSED|nr:hypothetical protein [Pseudomonas gingeri]NWB30253.1 hypothetical protein [Pseudomonas gingeri]NWC35672.1 hypothetical protein [Pseudomonas gingeri]NWD07190.1 hypothetical protein [Pseudomonas gingeri]NWE36597.1 hypothetical protein [Pseudomonas gingeri]NWE60942.1 hypothetical protein [Pseudomonas gingeri]